MRYLYCYDISNAKRLRAIAKVLKQKGLRIQRSFFICDFDYVKAIELLNEIKDIMNVHRDSVFMYGICDSCQSKVSSIGDGAFQVLEDFRII